MGGLLQEIKMLNHKDLSKGINEFADEQGINSYKVNPAHGAKKKSCAQIVVGKEPRKIINLSVPEKNLTKDPLKQLLKAKGINYKLPTNQKLDTRKSATC